MQGSPGLEPLRTRIYIDGHNFYCGCLKGTPYKWLDLLPLFEKHVLPSALVKDSNNLVRQSALLTKPNAKTGRRYLPGSGQVPLPRCLPPPHGFS
jgi:6-hydroxy-3-succinoylpyridine 3-monooxygenase